MDGWMDGYSSTWIEGGMNEQTSYHFKVIIIMVFPTDMGLLDLKQSINQSINHPIWVELKSEYRLTVGLECMELSLQ